MNVIDMVDVSIAFGGLRKVWVDNSINWAKMNYFSSGFLKLEGILPGTFKVLDVLYKPGGVAFFHSPAEHTFDGVACDVELQFFFIDKFMNVAAVSVFFDQVHGGRTRNEHLEALGLDFTGVEYF
jgi:hypothetical protein